MVGDMVVYAVAYWDQYYPRPNNVDRVFKDYDRAVEYLAEVQELCGNDYDYYRIFEYEVE